MSATRIFMLIAFASGLSNQLYLTTSAIYRVQVVGLDALQLVLVGTILEATVFLFEIPTGVVADVYSRRLSYIIGAFLVGLGFLIEGSFPLFSVVLLAQFVWGLGWTFMSGAHSAWIADEVGMEGLGQLFLQARQTALVASLLAIPLSVWLANQSLAWPYWVAGGIRMTLVVFLITFMPETGFQRKPPEEREGWHDLAKTIKNGIGQVRGSRVLMIYTAIALFVGLYSEGWDRLAEPFLLEQFNFPWLWGRELTAVDWFGLLSLVGILLGLVTNQIAKRATEQANGQKLLTMLQGLVTGMVASMIMFALTGNFWIAIGTMLAFDALRGLTYPLTQAWVNQKIESKTRATVLSMIGQIDAIGQTAGGPVMGAVGRVRSLQTAILTAAGILFPAIPLYGVLRKESSEE